MFYGALSIMPELKLDSDARCILSEGAPVMSAIFLASKNLEVGNVATSAVSRVQPIQSVAPRRARPGGGWSRLGVVTGVSTSAQ